MGLWDRQIFADASLSVAKGSAWDILFFVNEVFSATAGGHFGQAARDPSAQVPLALRCVRAILGRGSLKSFGDARFVTARFGGTTVGGALASVIRDESGKRVLVIEYLVVDAGFRRAGVGQALVTHLIGADLPLICFCAPKSTQMQNLLHKLRFKRSHAAHSIQAGQGFLVMPELWKRSAEVAKGPTRSAG
jgi:hypothetical protein